jgi:hypothetical protein
VYINLRLRSREVPWVDRFGGLGERFSDQETECLERCETVEGLPKLLASGFHIQTDDFENPGGRIRALVMTRVPGVPVTEIQDLKTHEILNIKNGVIKVLE